MTGTPNTPATNGTTPPAPGALPAELQYLQDKGEDIADLRSDLENLLPSNRVAPDPEPAVPQAPTQRTLDDALNQPLGVTRDGKKIERSTKPEPHLPDSLNPATLTQEQALNPLQPEGARTPPAEGAEPGEVVLDADGRSRDRATGRYVPHAALHAERLKVKEARAEAQKAREEMARAQERLDVLMQLANQAQQPASQAPAKAPEPEPEIDPETDIFASVNQLRKKLADKDKEIAETRQTLQQRLDAMSAMDRYRQDATSFAAQTPDFADAYRFLHSMRRAELQAMGFDDEAQINNQILTEERVLVNSELNRQNGSPAKRLYALARAKGFKGPEPQPTPAPTNGAAHPAPVPQPVPPAQPQPQPAPRLDAEAVQRVQNTQNGLQASTTLTGAGGASGEGLTIRQIADMSEQEFLDFARKMGGTRNLDRMFGWNG